MRLALACLFLLAAVPVLAGAPAPPCGTIEHSTSPFAVRLVRLRPSAWQLPGSTARSALRFEPEAGEPATGIPESAFAATANPLRARAEANVRTHADGSRHAVVGAAFRSWTIATIDEEGRLKQDCVQSESVARARVAAAARKAVRK